MMNCSSPVGNLFLLSVERHKMIGCGLPCVVPAVSVAEVVHVGADLILANQQAQSFGLVKVVWGYCRESRLQLLWDFLCCKDASKSVGHW